MSEWITIKEAPLYEVSPCGAVRRNGRILKPNSNGTSPHLWVTLRHEGKSLKRYIHRLVLTSFVCEAPAGAECRHLDGNPANNDLLNLAWGSRRQNYNDARQHGTNTKGSKHGMAKLQEWQIREIRRLREWGERPRDIGPLFNICPQHVSQICSKKIWRHV